MAENYDLHLPSLTIKGFRGIGELSIPRLGRVTLLAGMNSVGKTTVLDAVQVYAARGSYSTLHSILRRRDEVMPDLDEDGDRVFEPSWVALFCGRDSAEEFQIAIGSVFLKDQLTITKTSLNYRQMSFVGSLFGDYHADEPLKALKITYHGIERYIPLSIPYNRRGRNYIFDRGIDARPGDNDNSEMPPAIVCESLGPGLLSNNSIARFWDNVALTEDEKHAVSALGIIFGTEVDRVAVIGDDRHRRGMGGRRVMVKLKSDAQPVPLKSLGDGALRMFTVALALANSRDGFLLIDEAENGIHYSVQRDYWRMILHSAQENNVQVVATTHSGDCVSGFARAAEENEAVDGVLVRLSRKYGDLRTVQYPEEELVIADEQGIEVR